MQAEQSSPLKLYLESQGIQTAIHYPTALPNLQAYKYLNHRREDFEVASAYQDEILSLPMYPELDANQINYIADKIRIFFRS